VMKGNLQRCDDRRCVPLQGWGDRRPWFHSLTETTLELGQNKDIGSSDVSQN
jgi:hypothetical protein